MAGELVHFELPVSDLGRAQRFYDGLFGWEFQPYGDDYRFVPGRPSGGLYAGGQQGSGPIVYFDVEDIDRAAGRVRELGGSTEEILDMPGIGRSVHCRDDQGTSFSLFQPASAG